VQTGGIPQIGSFFLGKFGSESVGFRKNTIVEFLRVRIMAARGSGSQEVGYKKNGFDH